MSGVEAALLNVGRAVVTPLFTRWLGGRRRDRERTLPLSDLLRQKAKDEFSRRRGEREIEAVVDEVGERLRPLIRTRFAGLPEHEVEACLEAVADTFARADLTDDALFAADLDPARLKEHLGRAAPPAGLSELGQRLYDVALADCTRCFTEFVVQTAPFTRRASVEILERLTEVTALMSEAVQRLTVAVPESGGDFLARYREFLARKLNALELVGLDTQFRPRTTLSVAYISLAVSGDDPAPPARAQTWDPGLLRHARSDGNSAERVEQALAQRTRALIRGEAGSGKSTLLRWLAVTAAGDGFTGALAAWNGRIPFLVKLRSWPEALPAPEQFLTGVADPIAATKPPAWVTEQLRAGRALLLVDGVDELPAERRPRVRSWLRDLLTAYPDMIVIVTSRPPAAPVRWLTGEQFDDVTLERLSPADVRALVDQWHRAARTSPSLPCPAADLSRYEQALLNQLAANRHLYRLAGNPLMAAMLCALNLDRQTHLPPDRMGIYHAAVDMLLHRRDTERGVHSALPDMTVPERLQLLQDLAWRISLNGRSELTEPEATRYLEHRLTGMPRVTAPAADVLRHLIERSGILREPAAGRIDFVHRTFQEYLAAREAAEQNMGGLLATHAHLDAWREIIIMAAGLGNSPMRTELIRNILARADREPAHRRTLILLATACLETLPSLEPADLLAAIDDRLQRLLPPRSRNEARSLYPVGDPLLRRLPTESGELSGAQAAAVIRTAALINGPRALRLLAGYSQDARAEVQQELAQAWRFFDPDEYARLVLADAPLADGHLTVDEPALLRSIPLLHNLKTLELPFAVEVDLNELPVLPELESLRLHQGWRGELVSLCAQPKLQSLSLSKPTGRVTAPEIRQIRKAITLKRLYLYTNGGIDSETMAEVGKMTALESFGALLGSARTVDPLANITGLAWLHLYDGRVDSLDPLQRLPLTALGLNGITLPAGGARRDLGEVAPLLEAVDHRWGQWPPEIYGWTGCTKLLSVLLGPATLAALETLRLPPSLTTISLGEGSKGDDTESVDLSPLLSVASLRKLTIIRRSDDLDVSPLHHWTGGPLTVAVSRRQRVTGAEHLPPTVRISRKR